MAEPCPGLSLVKSGSARCPRLGQCSINSIAGHALLLKQVGPRYLSTCNIPQPARKCWYGGLSDRVTWERTCAPQRLCQLSKHRLALIRYFRAKPRAGRFRNVRTTPGKYVYGSSARWNALAKHQVGLVLTAGSMRLHQNRLSPRNHHSAAIPASAST